MQDVKTAFTKILIAFFFFTFQTWPKLLVQLKLKVHNFPQ